jgi:hypothetical protein
MLSRLSSSSTQPGLIETVKYSASTGKSTSLRRNVTSIGLSNNDVRGSLLKRLQKIEENQGELKAMVQKIAEGQSKTNTTIQEIIGNHDEITSSLKEIVSEQGVITVNQSKTNATIQEVVENQSEITSSLKDIVSEQGVISANQLEPAFLVHSLEETTQDRDELRITVRSQAGKMGAVTKKLKIIEKKISKMEAEREQTVERSEVMEEIRLINQDARRAEKRIALHLGINDQPLGDPSDNNPYSRWMDNLCDEFQRKLKENYEKAPVKDKRRDLPPLDDFPDAAKSRLFQYGLGVVLATPQNACNLENSPSKHRYDLVKLSGPIFDEHAVAKLKHSFEIQVEYLSGKLGEPYVENNSVYPLIEGDAFLSIEVKAILIFQLS